MRVEFDPSRISFQELLEKFFASADVANAPYSRQYRSAVLYHGEDQRAAVEALSLAHNAKGLAIEPATTFYRAEEYHQKYLAKMGSRW
mmetsp:Transcript_3985/g.12289  ORF Transcript_3985/g.12289 Transcript_3985/m.12289 type:complete len:88 (-) Transcript_3985:165-428(-)